MINDQFHTVIMVVCVCVCVCDHTQESMHHSVINDLFHTLIDLSLRESLEEAQAV